MGWDWPYAGLSEESKVHGGPDELRSYYAEKGREEGYAAGLEDGTGIGLGVGLEQGREEGREEGFERGLEVGIAIGVAIAAVAATTAYIGGKVRARRAKALEAADQQDGPAGQAEQLAEVRAECDEGASASLGIRAGE
jgi:hypothetical protein